MSKKEAQARLMAAVEQGVKQYFLQSEQANGELLLGGVVLSSRTTLKISTVDKEYNPHKFVLTLEVLS